VRRRPLHGFSLIELLVVISIIAVLIAMLLPALSAAREAGKRVKCASNLKQFNIGTMAYATDHHGVYLPHYGAFPDYVAKPPAHDARPLLLDYFKTSEAFYCPNSPRQPEDSQSFIYSTHSGVDHIRSGFLLWAGLIIEHGPHEMADTGQPLRFNGVGEVGPPLRIDELPAWKLSAMDFLSARDPSGPAPASPDEFRHGEHKAAGGNFAYRDGGVRWADAEDTEIQVVRPASGSTNQWAWYWMPAGAVGE